MATGEVEAIDMRTAEGVQSAIAAAREEVRWLRECFAPPSDADSPDGSDLDDDFEPVVELPLDFNEQLIQHPHQRPRLDASPVDFGEAGAPAGLEHILLPDLDDDALMAMPSPYARGMPPCVLVDTVGGGAPGPGAGAHGRWEAAAAPRAVARGADAPAGGAAPPPAAAPLPVAAPHGRPGARAPPPRARGAAPPKKESWRAHPDLDRMDLEGLKVYFSYPLKVACELLQVGETKLKRRCRALGVPRWPYRKLQSMTNLIQGLAGDSSADTCVAMQQLLEQKHNMQDDPSITMEQRTKRLRQARYKVVCKRKKAAAQV